ncbi:SDR family NAD(P)-dependent oxidoreductase [Sphingobium sp.]|uniref:SDR family NAD(P)-dependent oxidoreductase n=1 Tax=Sphingobium sp. TaxID=1912891 RepID=UPI0039C8C58E
MRTGSASGKVAIVTGGSEGIGEAVAQRPAEDGYRTTLVVRGAGRLAAPAAASGTKSISADLTHPISATGSRQR